MSWQGFALVLGGAFLYALYETINKKLLVKKRRPTVFLQSISWVLV